MDTVVQGYSRHIGLFCNNKRARNTKDKKHEIKNKLFYVSEKHIRSLTDMGP